MRRLILLLTFGWRHQTELLIDARRSMLQARTLWYPVMQLHDCCCVNHDGKGGSAPDPLAWDQGGPRKVRKTDIRINVDLASLPEPCGFLNGPWMQLQGGCISGTDVAAYGCVGCREQS